MNNQVDRLMKTKDIAEAGRIIISHFGIFSTDGRYQLASRLERANYKAVKNWLTKYQPTSDATNLEQMKGLLESFYHLCTVTAWELATELILLSIDFVNQELNGFIIAPLHLQLGRWGYYTEQIGLYNRLSDYWTPETQLLCLNGLGLVYQNLGNYAKAIEYHSQLLDLAKELAHLTYQQNALCNLGNAYGALGQYSTANAFYEQALNLAQKLGDRIGEGQLLGNIGVLYRLQSNFEQAIAYHQQHLQIALALEDLEGQANALENLGVAHYYLGVYEIAEDILQSSLRISAQSVTNKQWQ